MSEKKIVKAETMYGDYFSLEGDQITEQFLQFSAHQRNDLAMIKSVIKPGDNIMDIGAHIGSFSIPFAQFASEKGRVFAFEANPATFELLKKNIALNHLEEQILPFFGVVAEKKGAFILIEPEANHTGMHYYKPLQGDGVSDLSALIIDDWYEEFALETPIHFIKIDVEGAEIEVLRSCKNLIEKYKPALYVEIVQRQLDRFGTKVSDINDLLIGWGYHLFNNTGKRNSTHDRFRMTRLANLKYGGNFFDCLAVSPDSPAYPKKFQPCYMNYYYFQKSWVIKRMLRILGKKY
nr:FkbM family methyltransferase [Bacteroidota bacterium]